MSSSSSSFSTSSSSSSASPTSPIGGKLFLTSAQIEFLAEDTEIMIIPEFSSDAVTLLSGTFGPFQPAYPVAVPLWMAVLLKQRKRCRLVPPDWLHPDALEQTVQSERSMPKQFEAAPEHYFEVASVLLQAAPDDLQQPERLRGLLEDLWALRSTKVRETASSVAVSGTVLKATNMARMEINVWRQSLTLAMDHFHALSTSF